MWSQYELVIHTCGKCKYRHSMGDGFPETHGTKYKFYCRNSGNYTVHGNILHAIMIHPDTIACSKYDPGV